MTCGGGRGWGGRRKMTRGDGDGQGCRRRDRASEGGPRGGSTGGWRRLPKRLGGGYCRLHMPLRLALGVRGTVAGHRLGALEGGGGASPLFQCTPGDVMKGKHVQKNFGAVGIVAPTPLSLKTWGGGGGGGGAGGVSHTRTGPPPPPSCLVQRLKSQVNHGQVQEGDDKSRQRPGRRRAQPPI